MFVVNELRLVALVSWSTSQVVFLFEGIQVGWEVRYLAIRNGKVHIDDKGECQEQDFNAGDNHEYLDDLVIDDIVVEEGTPAVGIVGVVHTSHVAGEGKERDETGVEETCEHLVAGD